MSVELTVVRRCRLTKTDHGPSWVLASWHRTLTDDQLAQGFITSPMLADLMMIPADKQIGGACEPLGLKYSRFFDDITVSGPFNLRKSGIPKLIRRILKHHGFRANVDKEQFGSLASGDVLVTKLRVLDRRLDVEGAFVNTLVRQLKDHASLARGEEFLGQYQTPEQLRGRVAFVVYFNPRRRRELYGLVNKIDWTAAQKEAVRRGMIRDPESLF